MFRRRSSSSEESAFILDQRNLKGKINKNLAHIAKELQKEYRTSSAPVLSDSILSQHLCSVLESAFIHGLKSSYFEKEGRQSRSSAKNSFPRPQFWNLILKISHAETIKRVEALPFITSKIGRCRAWLRLTLNDGAVTSYLASILTKDQRSTLTHFYENHALFLDNEHADIFLRYLQGVENVVFELSFNSSVLNQWTKTPLELAGLIPPSTSVPLYKQIQSKPENNNISKPRLSVRHRASAPALLFHGQMSQSLPVVSGDEYLRRNMENRRQDKENSPRIEKTINEEPEGPDGAVPNGSTPTEKSVLHGRKQIKKRRRRSNNGKDLLESWSSSSGESMTSFNGGSGSSRSTPRTRSFCEPQSIVAQRSSPREFLESDLARRAKADELSSPNLECDIQLDGVFGSKVEDNAKSTPVRGKKNKNLVLIQKREKKGSNSSDKSDEIEPFKSFPPETPLEFSVSNPSSGLEDSTSSQSSANVESKIKSQAALADNYKMSFVTSSSSGPEDGKVQGQATSPELNEGQTLDGTQDHLTAESDVMSKSTDAIDIYSPVTGGQEDAIPQDSPGLSIDFQSSGRLGNSLSRTGGWSVPSTPGFDQSTPKSGKTSGFGSSFSQNVLSSYEETPVEIKLASPEDLSGEFPGEKGKKSPEMYEVFIRREGFLKKMGETFKQWKRRWFVLRGTTLSYYKDKNNPEPMGIIDLTDADEISEESSEEGADVVIIMNNGSKYHLAADNKATTLDWAADFRAVINGSTTPPEKMDEVPKSEDIYAKNKYLEEYEIITVPNQRLNGTNTSWYAAMTAHVGKIANEKGLDSQSYQCADCASPIGIIYGAPRVCSFTGQYYCSQCHANDESQIPARIIHNWDFRKHKVSKRSRNFIEQIFTDPVINLNDINPGIYKYIDEMGRSLQLRQQLFYLKPYLETCRSFKMDEIKSKLTGSRLHFLEDCHLYSMQDLCQVHDKSVLSVLNKLVNIGTKHVYSCDLCSAKGFLCEICQKDKIIFPFEIDSTVQCFECLSVFHRECKGESCPRCERRQQRLMRAAAEKMRRAQDEFDDSD